MKLWIFVFLFFLFQQENEWRLDKNEKGVKVYTRKVEGFKIRQFKVESFTSAPISIIDRLFRDIPEYPKWMPDVIGAKILEQVDENTYIYCMTINSPFPVSDRDLVAKMTFTQTDENDLQITYVGLPNYHPIQEEFIRITQFEGYWKFTQARDKTIIQNLFLTNPSGSVPSWVVNSFMASNPFNTVMALKKEIE